MSQDLVGILKTLEFHPVISFDAGRDKLLHFDFTENNKDLTDEILLDTTKFSHYIHDKLEGAGANEGTGLPLVYTRTPCRKNYT